MAYVVITNGHFRRSSEIFAWKIDFLGGELPGEIEIFLKFAWEKLKFLDPDPTTPKFQTRLTPLQGKAVIVFEYGCA